MVKSPNHGGPITFFSQVEEGEIGFASNDAIMATHLQNDDDPQKATSRASVCAGESAETAEPCLDQFLAGICRERVRFRRCEVGHFCVDRF